jgi:hypothetical protein
MCNIAGRRLLARDTPCDHRVTDGSFEGAAMFYRSADLLITDTHVVVLQPVPARFRLEAIESPYVVRHGRGANFRVGHEIRARYRSMDVRIFFTTDRARFGTVRRALIRALEHRAYPLPF